MNQLPLTSVTDPRIALYASRADYIARNGGDPVNNQPPPFDTTKPACEWSGPAGKYQIPTPGVANNLAPFTATTPVVPNMLGPYNYPVAPAPEPTSMIVQYGATTQPVDPRTLSTEAQAQSLAAVIAADTGVKLTVEETPPLPIPIPALTPGEYVYNSETGPMSRRVWELVGTVALPVPNAAPAGTLAKTVSVQFNVAALLSQQNASGVGAPGKWNVTVSAAGSVGLSWAPDPNTGQPTPGTPGAGDLGVPVQLSATQSIVLVGGSVMMVEDTAAANPAPASVDSENIQTILTVVQQNHADILAIGKALTVLGLN